MLTAAGNATEFIFFFFFSFLLLPSIVCSGFLLCSSTKHIFCTALFCAATTRRGVGGEGRCTANNRLVGLTLVLVLVGVAVDVDVDRQVRVNEACCSPT